MLVPCAPAGFEYLDTCSGIVHCRTHFGSHAALPTLRLLEAQGQGLNRFGLLPLECFDALEKSSRTVF
jgi:hypothetical protein